MPAPADGREDEGYTSAVQELRANSASTIASLRAALSAAEALARTPPDVADSESARLQAMLVAFEAVSRTVSRDLSEIHTARARAQAAHNRSWSPLLAALPDDVGAHILSHASLATHCVARLACRALRRWSRASLAGAAHLSTRMLERTQLVRPSLDRVLRGLHAHFEALTHVQLHKCDQLDDDHLALLPRTVRVLDLFGCTQVGTRGVNLAVLRCERLEEIILRGCHRVDNAAVQSIARHCGSLRGLSLSGCVRVSDHGVRALVACTELQRIGLHQCVHVTHACVALLARSAQLECIDLGRTHPAADDAGLASVWTSCPSLRWLNVQGLVRLTDATLEAIARLCPALERLVCGACERLTVAGLTAVCQQCPRLQWLHMRDLAAATDSWLLVAARLCAEIVSLDVRGCVKLTNAGVEEFYSVRRRFFPAASPARIELLADDAIANYAHMAARLAPRARPPTAALATTSLVSPASSA